MDRGVLNLTTEVLGDPERRKGFLAKLELLHRLESKPLIRFNVTSQDTRQFLDNHELGDLLLVYLNIRTIAPNFNHWFLDRLITKVFQLMRTTPKESLITLAEILDQRVSPIQQMAETDEHLLQPMHEAMKLVRTFRPDSDNDGNIFVVESPYRQDEEVVLAALDRVKRADIIFAVFKGRNFFSSDNALSKLSSGTLLNLVSFYLHVEYPPKSFGLIQELCKRKDVPTDEVASKILNYLLKVDERSSSLPVMHLIVSYLQNNFIIPKANERRQHT